MKNINNNEISALPVRKVSTEGQIANIKPSSLVDSRKKHTRRFGATFFLRSKEAPATEVESWEYLESKLSRRIKR